MKGILIKPFVVSFETSRDRTLSKLCDYDLPVVNVRRHRTSI